MPLLECPTFDCLPTGVHEAATAAVANGHTHGRTAPASRFSYDAIEDRKRRKPPASRTDSEDLILDQSGRRKLTATSRDIRRNYSVASWMIRRHLDFVSEHEFHSRSGDDGFDAALEELIAEWFRPENCDAAGRHPFAGLVRLAEAARTVDGDVALMKLATGHLQGIEGDRIRQPGVAGVVGPWSSDQTADRRWVHGVEIDRAGRALAYAIHNRNGSAFTFDRSVPADRLCFHGFYDRFDQVRGVSPIAQALNPLRDTYEGFDYALARAKVSQLFALAIYSQIDQATGEVVTGEDVDNDGKDERYTIDLGRGPVKLELDPGDKAEFLESHQPSSEFQAFTNLVLSVALKALDLPFNFFDESHTNFFGSRAAWLLYDRSCRAKRRDVLDLLRRITSWRIALWVQDRELTIPSGLTLSSRLYEWVPVGMPWWDPAKEITGDLKAIQAGLDTPQRITKERGRGDWFDNVDQIAQAMEYARSKGVPLAFEPAPEPQQVEVVEA